MGTERLSLVHNRGRGTIHLTGDLASGRLPDLRGIFKLDGSTRAGPDRLAFHCLVASDEQ